MKEIVTADDVRSVPPGGEIAASAGAVITPWAREVAASRGVRIVTAGGGDADRVVGLGADHAGFALKEEVKVVLRRLGFAFRDFGTHSPEPVDYPDIAAALARSIRAGEIRLGILVDGAGLGSAMAANKVPGVRATPCADAASARNAREHNDANVLTLGSRFLDAERAAEVIEAFLGAACTEERHLRRVAKITALERSYLK